MEAPPEKATQYNRLRFWTDLAQLLDKANFHALFIADVLGPYDVYKGPANAGPVIPSGAQFPINGPLYHGCCDEEFDVLVSLRTRLTSRPTHWLGVSQ
jgi:hypothetical protein